jgi:hypothetical protein
MKSLACQNVKCYADGAGDYRESNSSIRLLSPTGVTLQAISSLDGNEEIEGANSIATPISPADSSVAQPNSSSSSNAESDQARGSNNTDEKVEQGRSGHNTAEKVEQGRGGYNAIDGTRDNAEP